MAGLLTPVAQVGREVVVHDRANVLSRDFTAGTRVMASDDLVADHMQPERFTRHDRMAG